MLMGIEFFLVLSVVNVCVWAKGNDVSVLVHVIGDIFFCAQCGKCLCVEKGNDVSVLW